MTNKNLESFLNLNETTYLIGTDGTLSKNSKDKEEYLYSNIDSIFQNEN